MKIDAQQALEDAVKAAARADAVVVVAGLSPEWESEGYDRASLKLPGLQDELISKIAKVNDRTVVAVQSVRTCSVHLSRALVLDLATGLGNLDAVGQRRRSHRTNMVPRQRSRERTRGCAFRQGQPLRQAARQLPGNGSRYSVMAKCPQREREDTLS